MTKVVMTGSSGARSAKGRKPNGIINTKRDYAFFRKEFFNGIGETRTVGTGPGNDRKAGGFNRSVQHLL